LEWGVDIDWGIDIEANGTIPIFRQVAEQGEPFRGSDFILTTARQGTTYWDWALDPVRDEQGNITHLIHTAIDVTSQVAKRQAAQQAEAMLRDENKLVEAERKRLEVIEAVARGIQEVLDVGHIGKIAIEAIRTHLHAHSACLHIDKPE